MRISTRATLSLALAGALVAACSGAAAPQAPAADRGGSSRRPRQPAPTPKEITPPPASPTPTPMPTTDGQGAEVVRGLEVLARTDQELHHHQGR